MAEYDGEIRIKATIDTDEFDKKASNLTKKLYSQNNALKRQQYILSELNQKYSDIVNKIVKTAEETSLEKSLKRAENELSLFQKQYNEALNKSQTLNLVKKAYNREGVELPPDYEADFKKAESEVLKFKSQIESTNSEIKRLQKELEKVRLNPENTKTAKDLQYKISLTQEKAGNLRDKIHETSEELNKIRLSKVSKMEESFKRLSDTLKGKFQGISSLFGRTFSATVSSVTSPLRLLIRGFERLGRRILRLSGLVLIFNSVRSSLRGLRDYLGGAVQTNDVFVRSLAQIKSNLMTAFYPVYQYILPALNALMGTSVKASAYLAQFMSMIFGKNTHESQKGAKILNDQTLAIKNQKKSYDELGKSVRKAKGELASFDKLMVLHQDNQKKPKPTADSGFVFSPTTSFDNDFNNMANIFDIMREKIKPTVEAFKKLGETINKTFGSFAVKLGKDFYNEFLKPLGEWTLGKGLPEFARITEDMFKNIDWNRLNAEFKDFFKALEPFSETIGEGLLWFYENVLTKIGTWTFNKVLPRAIDSIKGSIKALDPVLDGVSDTFKWFFKDVIKDIANFTGNKFLSFWDKLNEKIDKVSDTLEKEQKNKSSNNITLGNILGTHALSVGTLIGGGALVSGAKKLLPKIAETTSSTFSKLFSTLGTYTPFAAGGTIVLEQAIQTALLAHQKISESAENLRKDLIKNYELTEEEFDKMTHKATATDEEIQKIQEKIAKKQEKNIKEAVKGINEVIEAREKERLSEEENNKKRKDGASTTSNEYKTLWQRAFDKIIQNMAESIGISNEKINTFGQDLIKGFENTGEILKKRTLDIKDDIVKRFTEAKDTIVERWNEFSPKFTEFGIRLGDSFKEGILSAVRGGLRSMQNFINDMIKKINAVIGFARMLPGADWIKTIPEISIPALAQGAVLRGGNPMIAYLNDQPRGQINIETPLKTMIDAFDESLRRNGNNQGNVTIEASGDVGKLISFLDFKLKQENQRIGNNFVTGDVWI